MQKILITGSNGFIGKNLAVKLKELKEFEILKFDLENSSDDLINAVRECDFIVHLAGSNRPVKVEEFKEVNLGLTKILTDSLLKDENEIPILFASSTQAELDNPYGKSKLEAEEHLINFSKSNNNPVYIYRFANVFGKWSQPNYNSVVATFCNNIAKNLPITINDPTALLKLIYIDDVVSEIVRVIKAQPVNDPNKRLAIDPVYNVTVGKLAELITSFKESRINLNLPDINDELTKKLYSTYLSYLNEDDFLYNLISNKDERGRLTELFKSEKLGQVFVSTTKPGVTRGNHYHHTKTEKFIILKGKALICFRQIHGDKIIKYEVDGENITPVDIPTGYTHNITNIGEDDLITLFWANEIYDPERTDTFYEEV